MLLVVASAGCDAVVEREPQQLEPSESEPLGEWLLHEDDVSLSAGESKIVRVHVPDDALSLVLTVVGQTKSTYRLCDWAGGDGTIFVHTGWEAEPDNAFFCATCDTRIYPQVGVFTANVPNGSSSRVAPGDHLFRICSDREDDEIVSLYVHAKRGMDVPLTGSIDLNLFFAGVDGWTAKTAPHVAELQSALAQTASILRPAGIQIGNIAYHDASDEYATPNEAQLHDLVVGHRGEFEIGIPIFFVDHYIASQVGTNMLAQSLCLPGAMALTGQSGVVVSVQDVRGDSRGMGALVAHEIGHYLGLYHTTEGGYAGYDVIDDTPEDDDSYLMHVLAEGAKISPTQARLMRVSPFVY